MSKPRGHRDKRSQLAKSLGLNQNAPIGCMIAQRLTSALTGHFMQSDNRDYKTLANIVYGEISDIANEQEIGDWIETADGSTYRLEYKPNKIS